MSHLRPSFTSRRQKARAGFAAMLCASMIAPVLSATVFEAKAMAETGAEPERVSENFWWLFNRDRNNECPQPETPSEVTSETTLAPGQEQTSEHFWWLFNRNRNNECETASTDDDPTENASGDRDDSDQTASETPDRDSGPIAGDRPSTDKPDEEVRIPNQARILYVNAATGNDSASATEAAPLRTITAALGKAQPGDTVKLAPGTYSAETGESFPLQIPTGVTLRGNDGDSGKSTSIVGSGNFISRTFARQSAAVVVAKDDVTVSGVTISNPAVRGTGLWIESANPTVQFNAFKNSHRDGIFVTGTSQPDINNNLFQANGGNGIAVARSAGGHIHENWFQSTGFGMAVSDSAAPQVANNHFVSNKDGMVLSGSAKPVLRGNVIEDNQRDGIVAISNAQPDLGTSADPGNNTIRNNGRYNLHNATSNIFAAVGNQMGGQIVGRLLR